MKASVQRGRGQLLSITGRRGAPSPSCIDGRLRILNTYNTTKLNLHFIQNNDNLPVKTYNAGNATELSLGEYFSRLAR